MEPHSFLSKLLSLAILLSFLTLTSTAHPPNPQIDGTDFISTSCKLTPYPRLCQRSLSPHADTIGNNPAKLANVSILISYPKVQNMTTRVTTLLRQVNNSTPTDQLIRRALNTCAELFIHAVKDLQLSAETMHHLGTREKLKSQVDFVKWHVNHALSVQNMCSKIFQETIKGELPIKSDMSRRITRLTRYTDNAVSLVNNYSKTFM